MKLRVVGIALVAFVFAFVMAALTSDKHIIRRVTPTPVLVATQPIPKGTPGSLIASQSMYAATTLPPKGVEVGAIADPTYLRGRASLVDIVPGQQLTADDFTASDVGTG